MTLWCLFFLLFFFFCNKRYHAGRRRQLIHRLVWCQTIWTETLSIYNIDELLLLLLLCCGWTGIRFISLGKPRLGMIPLGWNVGHVLMYFFFWRRTFHSARRLRRGASSNSESWQTFAQPFFFVEIASADVKSHVCLVNLTQTMHPGLYLVASLTCSFLVK
jgi:hypothetical protein